MAQVKLHRCPFTFLHTNVDACWKTQKALDEAGIDYEIVKEPYFPKSRRTDMIENTGQALLPAIELPDGTWYREESDDMVATIKAGELLTRGGGPESG